MAQQAIRDNQRKENDRIPYNGIPLQEGETLVPQLVSREFTELAGVQGVRTWYTCGVPYLVMFVPVPAEMDRIARSAFTAQVNDYLNEQLGRNRYSRCLVPRPDGSRGPCPKEENGVKNRCGACPYRGQLEKEDRSMVSLESLDGENFHPMETAPSAEECVLEKELLDELIRGLRKIDPRFEEIIRSLYQGLGRKEILEKLRVRKSRGYQLFNECMKEAKKILISAQRGKA